jgi:hypothetical protein
MNGRFALVLPTLRAVRWAPLLAAAGTGLAIVTVPAAMSVSLGPDNLATLLRLGVACAAVGIAFVFDDPAKPTTATTPTPVWRSLAIRATAAALVLTAWWTAALAITLIGAEPPTGDDVLPQPALRLFGVSSHGLPLQGLTVEAATLGAIALAVAVTAWRLAPRGLASPAAAPTALTIIAALAFAPRRLPVFVSVASPEWSAAHQRLAILLAASLLTAAAAAVLTPPRRRRTTPTATKPTTPPAAATTSNPARTPTRRT